MSKTKSNKFCIPCAEIMKCVKLTSPDNSIKIINKGEYFEITTKGGSEKSGTIRTIIAEGTEQPFQRFTDLIEGSVVYRAVAISMSDQIYNLDKFHQENDLLIWTLSGQLFIGTIIVFYEVN